SSASCPRPISAGASSDRRCAERDRPRPERHRSCGPGRAMSVEAVVFDLDGVLVDSEPVWEAVRRDFVTERGGHWRPDSQQRLMGMSTPEWAGYLVTDLGVGGMSAQEVAAAVVDQMAERYRVAVPLLPGAATAARLLAGRWPLGLASSSPRRLIDVVLDHADLAGLFATIVST